MTKDNIYIGIVKSIGTTYINIEVEHDSKKCSGCSISSLCSVPVNASIIIDVENPSHYKVGQKVEIKPIRYSEWRALWMFFVIPLILLLFSLGIMSSINVPQLLTAIIIIIIQGLYFISIYRQRKLLERKIHWSVTGDKTI